MMLSMKFWRTDMAYTQQIKILEEKIQQLLKNPISIDNNLNILKIQAEVKRLRRIEYEELYERINLDEER